MFGIGIIILLNMVTYRGVEASGILLGILSVYSVRTGIKHHVPKIAFTLRNLGMAAKEAAWELPLPFIVIGGIYGGAFTATEAAAVTAFYVFIVEVLIYKDLKVRTDVPRVMKESMLLVGAIMAILGTAFGLTNYLIDQQVPQRLFELVREHIDSKIAFLLILNGFLIIVGMMMDIFSAIIVVVPLILPIAREFGVDPVHLGIIFLTNLEIGYMTPPVGLNLFLSGLRFRKPILTITRAVLIFIVLELLALLLITYIPGLSLWPVEVLGTR